MREQAMVDEAAHRGCLISAGAEYRGRQGLDYRPGVSAESVGATGLWVGTVEMPPGARTIAHFHESHETGIYLVSGDTIDMYSGGSLEVHEVCRPGDYLYIAPGVPHVAVNRSQTTAVAVIARTDPNEQESVVLLPELESRVP
jgi:uncharacterized RmlC-like cupin family protein